MKFSKSTGAWLDKSTLESGTKLTLVTEAIEQEGQNGTQIVAKAKVEGQSESRNVAINNPSKNALIDAFGPDSINWVDKPLSTHVEKTVVGGKRGYALYLIPEGFELGEDSEGYVVISKAGDAGDDEVISA